MSRTRSSVVIDFRREQLVDRDHEVVLSCRLARLGRSSVNAREEVRTSGGELAVDAWCSADYDLHVEGGSPATSLLVL
jgi:hypothetical protein